MVINKVISAGVDAEPVLLWTNPRPNDSFYGRTLTLDTGFKAYLIEFKSRVNVSDPSLIFTGIAFVPFGGETRYAAYIKPGSYSTYDIATFQRAITASDGTVAISDGYTDATYHNSSVCIPLRIWGVPWTL